jgi:hypothetical protein
MRETRNACIICYGNFLESGDLGKWDGRLTLTWCVLRKYDIMIGGGPCRKLTLHKPEGIRRVGRPAIRWLDSIEEDLKIMGFRNWRRKTQDRYQWRAIVEEAKVRCGL